MLVFQCIQLLADFIGVVIVIIKIFKNTGGEDIFQLGLNTELATTFDHLNFIQGVNEIIISDIESLERSANLVGRTVNHNLKNSVGSIPKDP